MPKHSFSIRHYLLIIIITGAMAHTEYNGLAVTGQVTTLTAGLITFACTGATLSLWGGLTANPTRYQAPLDSYTMPQLVLWLFTILLAGGYTLRFSSYALDAAGINPLYAFLVAIIGGYLGSVVFTRHFVPPTWGPAR